MRRITASICATLLLLSTPTDALDAVYCSAEKCDRNPQHLEQFVEVFYIWYIISSYENQISWSTEPVKSKLQEVLTPELYDSLQKIADETDYEPVLYAQDYSPEWLHPHAKLINIGKGTARLKVSFISNGWPAHVLNIQLEASTGKWRINKISPELMDDK